MSSAGLRAQAEIDSLELLRRLLSVDSPVGDEYRMADSLVDWLGVNTPEANLTRLRDCLVVIKGAPKVAVFAHIDTNGLTVGYDKKLIPIGSPALADGDRVRVVGQIDGGGGQLCKTKADTWKVKDLDCSPGDRLVFADSIIEDCGRVQSPYLDNRAGLCAALITLLSCEHVAVAFTTGEEVGASGATICAHYLYDNLKLTTALVADITWHTDHVKCGSGVAISRRDHSVPSQRLVGQVLTLAKESGIPYQVEIESDGGSDGTGIERSGKPIDWIFVGAPEERPHTSTESLDIADIDAMSRMLIYLVDRLTEAT